MNTLFQKCILIILCIAGTAQSGFTQNKAGDKTVVIDRREVCLSNPKHSYQLYIPSVDTSFKQLPLLISIDPHGNGQLAVEGFREAARKYQVIVASSNQIKNNTPEYIQLINELITDVKNRFPAGKILFIGGFSGGARMAIGYASEHPVDGVIAYGALASAKQLAELNCKTMMVIGMDDFNFLEAAPFVIQPQQMPSSLYAEITGEYHKWPEENILFQSLAFMVVSTMPPGTSSEKKRFVQEFAARQKERIDAQIKLNNYVEAALITRTMFIHPYFEREFPFFSLFDQILNHPGYQQQITKLNGSVQFESRVRKEFYHAVLEKDTGWWNREIELLNNMSTDEKERFMRAAYTRLKGYLGIMCYSMCELFAEEKNAANLEKVLAIYRLAEPDNPAINQYTQTLSRLKESSAK